MAWLLFGIFLFLVVVALDAFLGGLVGALVGFLAWLILRRDSRKRVILRAACLGAAASVVTNIGTVLYSKGRVDNVEPIEYLFEVRVEAAAIVPVIGVLVSLTKPKPS